MSLYIISEEMVGEGAGAMTALAFGLATTNYSYFMNKLGKPAKVRINVRKLREFHEEIVFFIKSFFFVYIGVVVTLSWKYTFIGFTLVILQMVMRYALVSIIGKTFLFTREEVSISKVVYASGMS